MRCLWILWFSTDQERKAAKLLKRVADILEYPAEDIKYQYDVDIPGFRAVFKTALRQASRDGCIVEAIALCERVGSNWTIEGSVHKGLSFVSQATRISGVSICECYLVAE